mmetsp:Transcript_46091/g.128140  ORF Transcript_46091/g.128140 Transcript_46091/m.128140 type:complete len:211 (+) Transcript_46091:247-879(+)
MAHNSLVCARLGDAGDGGGQQAWPQAACEQTPIRFLEPQVRDPRRPSARLDAGLQHVHGVHQHCGHGARGSGGTEPRYCGPRLSSPKRSLAIFVNQPPDAGFRQRRGQCQQATSVQPLQSPLPPQRPKLGDNRPAREQWRRSACGLQPHRYHFHRSREDKVNALCGCGRECRRPFMTDPWAQAVFGPLVGTQVRAVSRQQPERAENGTSI